MRQPDISTLTQVESIKRTPTKEDRVIRVSHSVGNHAFTLFRYREGTRYYVEVLYRENDYEERYVSRCAIVSPNFPLATLQAWIRRNIRA